MSMKEMWKDISNYESIYQVSSHGNIRRVKTNRILKWSVDKRKICSVHLFKDGNGKTFHVHRLVATAFVENSLGLPDINHKDRNRLNNHKENLEWVTKKQNNSHSRMTDVLFLIDQFQTSLPSEKRASMEKMLSEMKQFVHKKWASK